MALTSFQELRTNIMAKDAPVVLNSQKISKVLGAVSQEPYWKTKYMTV